MAFLNLLRRNAQRVALVALLIAVMGVSGISAQASTPSATLDGGGHGQIAFISGSNLIYDIDTINPDGSHLLNLTRNPANDFWPEWSPDGRQIAFVSDRDGHQQIYLMNTDGSALVRLTHSSEQDYAPAWSPDGTCIP